MAEYGFKELSSIDTEDSFSSETSKHIIVEDGGNIKRLNSTALSPGQFVATFSGTTEHDNATCDKTFEEIKQAFIEGKQLIFRWKYRINSDDALFYLSNVMITFDNAVPVTFICGYLDIYDMNEINNGYGNIRCFISSDSITITDQEI